MIQERKNLIKKLKKADEQYIKMITLAEKERDHIIDKANQVRDDIIAEGKSLAEQERKLVLESATTKSLLIIEDANKTKEKILAGLNSAWSKSILEASKSIIQNLFDSDEELQQKYLKAILKESLKYNSGLGSSDFTKNTKKLKIKAKKGNLSRERSLLNDLSKF